ncbi:MAG: hypothetical protein V4850_27940 [Myxococcota bacterium]
MLTRADFVFLAPVRQHTGAEFIRRASRDLAVGHALVDPTNERRFAAFNTLAPHVYPRGDAERVVTAAMWCNWLFFFDDQHDEAEGRATGVDALRARMEAYLGVLRGGPADPADPLACYAATFVTRALSVSSPAWLRRFCASVEGYLLQGALPAYAHYVAGTAPSRDAYLAQRDEDSAVGTALDLLELIEGIELSDAVRADPDHARLRQMCIRTIACFNDIVSYPKEVIVQGNPNNLVHVLQLSRGLSLDAAMAEAVDETNAAAAAMEAAEQALRARHPEEAEALTAFAHGLRAWQVGNIESSLVEARYRSPHSPFAELRPGGGRDVGRPAAWHVPARAATQAGAPLR